MRGQQSGGRKTEFFEVWNLTGIQRFIYIDPYIFHLDVEKEQDQGNDGHGSKVIVIPFDGAALDRDLQSAADSPKP